MKTKMAWIFKHRIFPFVGEILRESGEKRQEKVKILRNTFFPLFWLKEPSGTKLKKFLKGKKKILKGRELSLAFI